MKVIFSVMMIGEVGPSMGLPNHAPDDAAGARARFFGPPGYTGLH